MAYIEPKTNWVAGNIPVASDFNRIEGNTKQNHDDIVAEAVARAADVDAEGTARTAAIISSFSYGATGPGDYIIPAYPQSNAVTASSTYVKLVEFKTAISITATIKFKLASEFENQEVYARIYINGVAVGTERSTTTTAPVSFSENISILAGDLVQLYAKKKEFIDVHSFVYGFAICGNGYGKLWE